MSRYMIKFSKEGIIRYISHLDLLRLFKRSFKRMEIRLEHSKGFNPHPKMSFAQPLSLGYFSSAEYLEFETSEAYPPECILEKIRMAMPEEIEILLCDELPPGGKTLAARTESADYEIKIPLEIPAEFDLEKNIRGYVSQDQILVSKHQRKTGKEIVIDIKPMLHRMEGHIDNNLITLTIKIAAGSTANLSPEIVLTDFVKYTKLQFDRTEASIRRTELYFAIG